HEHAHSRAHSHEACATLLDAVDRHAALVAGAHSAERRSSFAAFRNSKGRFTQRQESRRDGRSAVDSDGTSVDADLDRLDHAGTFTSCGATARVGANARAGIAGALPATRSARIPAVASDVVMPSPSWPAATQRPGVGPHSPINGSLSGVAGRKPVQQRITETLTRLGTKSTARASMRWSTARLMDASQPTNSREDPISIWPVLRGWRLNATDSVVIECALVR